MTILSLLCYSLKHIHKPKQDQEGQTQKGDTALFVTWMGTYGKVVSN